MRNVVVYLFCLSLSLPQMTFAAAEAGAAVAAVKARAVKTKDKGLIAEAEKLDPNDAEAVVKFTENVEKKEKALKEAAAKPASAPTAPPITAEEVGGGPTPVTGGTPADRPGVVRPPARNTEAAVGGVAGGDCNCDTVERGPRRNYDDLRHVGRGDDDDDDYDGPRDRYTRGPRRRIIEEEGGAIRGSTTAGLGNFGPMLGAGLIGGGIGGLIASLFAPKNSGPQFSPFGYGPNLLGRPMLPGNRLPMAYPAPIGPRPGGPNLFGGGVGGFNSAFAGNIGYGQNGYFQQTPVVGLGGFGGQYLGPSLGAGFGGGYAGGAYGAGGVGYGLGYTNPVAPIARPFPGPPVPGGIVNGVLPSLGGNGYMF